MSVLSYFFSGTTEARVTYCVTSKASETIYTLEPTRSYAPSHSAKSRDRKWRWWHEYIPKPVSVTVEWVVSQVLFIASDFINTSESFVQKRRTKRKRFILSMEKEYG